MLEVYCVPARLPALSPLGFLLFAFAFWVSVWLYRTGCLPSACLLPSAVWSPAPCLASDLPPSLCLMLGIRSEADYSLSDSVWHGSISLSSTSE